MSDFRTYITQTGFGLERDAKFNNTQVGLAVLVVGDGVLPDAASPAERTDLIHQVREYAITIEKDEKDPNVWIARGEIPASDGGFFIKEAGIKTTDGELYSYARQAGDYKPLLEEGQGKSYTIRLKFVPGNADAIQIKIDPSVQFATPTDLENAVKEHLEEEDPHQQYHDASKMNRGILPRSRLPIATEDAIGAVVKANDTEVLEGAADKFPDAKQVLNSIKLFGLNGLVGSIQFFFTKTAPNGFVRLNGSELSRVSYANLYAFAVSSGNIYSEGTQEAGQFGDGDGETTFTIPNVQGYFIRPLDESGLIDPTSGRALGSVQSSDNLSHSHSMGSAGTHAHSVATMRGSNGSFTSGGGAGDNGGTNQNTSPAGAHTHPIYSSGGSEARPSNIVLCAFIKY
jgi:phage-related tail fiber protein